MRDWRLKTLAIAGIVLGTSLGADSASAREERFSCRSVKGVWTTVVNSAEGKVPLIRWTSGNFARSRWTNKARCLEVSERFRRYDSSGRLKSIRTGIVNRHPVLCATRSRGEKCTATNILLTLKPGTDAREALQELLDIRRRASSRPAISLNDQLIAYEGDDTVVDLDLLIDASPVNSVDSPAEPSSVPLF